MHRLIDAAPRRTALLLSVLTQRLRATESIHSTPDMHADECHHRLAAASSSPVDVRRLRRYRLSLPMNMDVPLARGFESDRTVYTTRINPIFHVVPHLSICRFLRPFQKSVYSKEHVAQVRNWVQSHAVLFRYLTRVGTRGFFPPSRG